MNSVRELLHYRELLWMLAWRDIRVRYKHSVLGAAWAVAPPVLTMLTFLFVFQQGLGLTKLSGDSGLPYPLFALLGLVPWTFFASGLTSAVGSLTANRNLLTKVYFPREVFPISAIVAGAIDALVGFGLVVCVATYFRLTGALGVQFGAGMAWVVVAFVLQVALMVGLGLILAMANLFYRDVGFVFRAVLPLAMFVTNVLYPLKTSHPVASRLIAMNPMIGLIDTYRAAFCGAAPPIAPLAYAAICAIVLLVVGGAAFHRSEHAFAERAE